jgi:DNA-binding MarR family transcriptional regulator
MCNHSAVDETARTLPQLPCVCASVRRAARAVTLLYDQALQGTGVRSTQFSILYPLAEVGEMTQGQLAALLLLDKTTMTRSLGLLERSGWIQSCAGQDRRKRLWRLTPKGRRVLQRAIDQWGKAQRKVLRRTKRDWEELRAALDDLAGAAQP